MTTRIGVLALQGGVREHVLVLQRRQVEVVTVRRPGELAGVDGLVIPGGESSVIDRLARTFGLREPLVNAIADGLPVYGTCAGMILLADRIEGGLADQQSFGGIDMTVRRNAFGNQLDSGEWPLSVPALGDEQVMATFIRAPAAIEVGPGVEVLATFPGDASRIVAVRHRRLLATAFHPEVSDDDRFHRHFIELVRST